MQLGDWMNTEESVYRVVNTVLSLLHFHPFKSQVHKASTVYSQALFFQDWEKLTLVAPFLRVFMDGLKRLERRTATIWR